MRKELSKPLNVHVLVDLDWMAAAGGQVSCWQNLAAAAAGVDGLSLTIHAQGADEERRSMQGGGRLWLHPPVFSTRRLPFLGHVPAQTDLARYHRSLARALAGADVIHTTDGFFAYARTAAVVARRGNTPLVTSVHTDTVAYSELFCRAFLRKRLAGARIGAFLDETLRLPQIAAARMRARLARHQRDCAYVLVSRPEDWDEAARTVAPQRVRFYRLGVDYSLFSPAERDSGGLRRRFGIPDGATIVAFVGRLDEGKNIGRLIRALQRQVSMHPFFLVAVGEGPEAQTIRTCLAGHAVTPGFLSPTELARIYASADWLALPSLIETWSLVAGEALACGLPVIAAAQSGVGRFLDNGKAGLIVGDDTDEAWQAALLRAHSLAGNEELRLAASRAARAHFPTWEDVLRQDFLPVWNEAARKYG